MRNIVKIGWIKVAVIVMVLVAMPVMALAATAANPCKLTDAQSSNNAAPPKLGECVSQIYLWAMGAAGLLGLIMAIVGGYLVITASGNAAQAAKGKSFLYSALIGIAILLAAYLILSTINPDLVKFDANFDDLNKAPTGGN